MVKGRFTEETFQPSPEGRKNGQSKGLRQEEQGGSGKYGKNGRAVRDLQGPIELRSLDPSM